MKRLALLLALLAGCAQYHVVSYPVEVDISTLTGPARDRALEAMSAWNDAIGTTVFWLGDQGVQITQDAPEGVCIDYYEDERAIRFEPYCATLYSFEHELGHVLGLEDDELTGSIMNPGPWPNTQILPEHVQQVRELMAGRSVSISVGGAP